MNFLEQLAAEWFQYRGFLVRTNARARKRARGGWDSELDVLAYKPADRSLIHIETSADTDSWQVRKKRFLGEKFILSKDDYEKLLEARLERISKVVIIGLSESTKENLNWGSDIEVWPIPFFIGQITLILRKRHPTRNAVPEGFPILRGIQMTLAYENT
jgi:hypothetical protein